LALRFSDVIGPRDTTHRWYVYQLWVKFQYATHLPVVVPPNVVDVKETLTFVKDAAESVVKAFKAGPQSWDQAYNVAMEEEVTLWGVIQKMAKVLNVEDVQQVNAGKDGERAFYLYPTVFNGPVDTSKARKSLDFEPTELDAAVEETVKWYDDLFLRDEEAREEMLKYFASSAGLNRDAKDKLEAAVARLMEEEGLEISK